MTHLRHFPEDQPQHALVDTSNYAQIQALLSEVGVQLERWEASAEIAPDASNDEILAAYQSDIDRLVAQAGYQSWDVVSMVPNHPDKAAFRSKFLEEHTHAEDEVRFFVRGQGLFTLHINGQVFELLCEKGDLIRVPAGTKHWFDMGPNPEFTAIRLFNNPEGWIAQFTGDNIAQHFSRLDN